MSNWMAKFDGRLEVCPPLKDDQLNSVPAKRGVLLLAGGRGHFRQELVRRMKQASANLDFEAAAGFKTRLKRLETFDAETYRHVRPAKRSSGDWDCWRGICSAAMSGAG